MRNAVQYTLEKCLNTGKQKIVEELSEYITAHQLPVSDSQIGAWEDCIDFLHQQFSKMQGIDKQITLLFEYMLPLERGRRPDVILMVEGKVIILEFKAKAKYQYQDIEQAIGYREDIKHFHEHTVKSGLEVMSYLVLTKAEKNMEVEAYGVPILTPSHFTEVIKPLLKKTMAADHIELWLRSKYYPVPSIIESTQKLFFEGHLPYIKSIAEGEIAEAVDAVVNVIRSGEEQGKKRIVFISGVPGAGKTLVGLKTVYDYSAKQYYQIGHPIRGIYLSGNGPLVNVLQAQLSTGKVNGIEGKAYVQGMINFKKDYVESKLVPEQTVIVFDEAQRAWDSEKMNKHYSEAEALLKIGDKVYKQFGYVTIVCLIGEGQTIHIGEEKGMKLWEEALGKAKGWEVYIAPRYSQVFHINNPVIQDTRLHLDTSIRTNFVDISKWIEAVLQGNEVLAAKEFKLLLEQGFVVRCTRQFATVARVVDKMQEKYPERKCGLLVSSKTEANRNKRYTNGRYQTSFIKDTEAGRWFLEDCVKLERAASEFLCQGLEIDMPIVLFGGDYTMQNRKWHIDEAVRQKYEIKYKDIETIIENIYRVLLSRGRKGMVLLVPEEEVFNETYNFLRKIGVPKI